MRACWGGWGERGSKIPLCPQILYLMLAVSFYSLVTQDDPKCHSLGKHRNESPQSLTGTVKVSESLVWEAPSSLAQADAG